MQHTNSMKIQFSLIQCKSIYIKIMLIFSMSIFFVCMYYFVWKRIIRSYQGQNCKRKSIWCMFLLVHVFIFPAEAVKNALKHLQTPKDMSPAVKISASDYHPCSKHCVFVCQRLILLQPSHLHILPLHPHPTHAYSFTL